MTAPPVFSKPPRLNHVAMSVPADLLDADGRREIVDFYHSVFGWVEHEVMTEDRRRLVLGCYTHQQFVFLIADDPPMQCPRLDHFGMQVATRAELDDIWDRVAARRAVDERVDVIEPKTEDLHEVVRMSSFYVRFLLPLMVEVQYWEYPGQA